MQRARAQSTHIHNSVKLQLQLGIRERERESQFSVSLARSPKRYAWIKSESDAKAIDDSRIDGCTEYPPISM